VRAVDDREQRILDAAQELITHYGYDKTRVSELADGAGVSKGTIYLHFDSKEDLFEALLIRELIHHGKAWMRSLEEDPKGGTLGGMYRSILTVRSGSALVMAMMQQNRKIMGSYLDRPGNLLEGMYGSGMGPEIFEELQRVGCVRSDVDPRVLAHLGDLIEYGLISINEVKPPESIPSFEETVEMIAQMMERAFAPPGGGDSEAGKAVFRRFMGRIAEFLENSLA
jgi:AcrR family transcriptional regulator